MVDVKAYMEFFNYRGAKGVVRLMLNPGFAFVSFYRFLSFANEFTLAKPFVYICFGLLCRFYSCEISMKANVSGPLILPHPIGVVIGEGVCLSGVNVVYQNVTIGQNSGLYPKLVNCKVYPGSVIAGQGEYEGRIFGALSRVIV